MNFFNLSEMGLANGVVTGLLYGYIAMTILTIIGLWLIFKKASRRGWWSLIPCYNVYELMMIAKMNIWHFLAVFVLSILSSLGINYVSELAGLAVLVYWIVINIKLSKAFGKGIFLGIICILFPYIGYMILGCGSAKYVG